MNDRELMQMALDALFTCQEDWIFDGEDERPTKTYDEKLVSAAFKALRARLAQPETQAIMWLKVDEDGDVAGFHWAFQLPQGEYSVYPVPYQSDREWQGMTDEEIQQILWKELGIGQDDDEIAEFARAIEAKLKEKNA